MPCNARKKRLQNKQNYVQNKENVLVTKKEYYSSNQEKLKANSKVIYDANPDKRAATRASYSANSEKRKQASHDSYSANPENKKQASHASYLANPENKKQASRDSYSADPEKQKQASRDSYSADPEKQKQASRDSYSADPEKSKAASRASYSANPEKQKQASRDSYAANPAQRKASSRKLYSANPDAKRLASRILYAKSRAQKNKSCSEYYRRNRYRLAEPKRRVKDLYENVTQRNLILDNKARIEVVKVVRKRFPIVVKRNLVSRIASGYAARRLINKSLRVRKEHAGNLLKATREITRLSIKGEKDFGDTIHTASSEPYFHDSAYQQVQRHTAVTIDERGRCFVANGVSTMVRIDKTASPTQPKTEQQLLRWKCCSECKPLTKAEVCYR